MTRELIAARRRFTAASSRLLALGAERGSLMRMNFRTRRGQCRWKFPIRQRPSWVVRSAHAAISRIRRVIGTHELAAGVLVTRSVSWFRE